ncbi:MAG: glycosyltransferase family 4 protein [Candidatus Sumerlaeia bacterium]
MSPLRILHTIASWRWTGAAEPMAGLALHQQRLGHDVRVACVGGGSLEKMLRKMGVPVHTEIDFLPRLEPLALVRQPRELFALFRRNSVQIIHTHLAHDHWVAALALRRWPRAEADRSGRPLLARTMHRFDLRRDPLHRWLFARQTGLIFGVTRGQIAQMRQTWGLNESQTALMRGAIDLERFRPGGNADALRRRWNIPPSAPLVGMVGRMRRDRGHHWLLDAAPLVLQQVPEAHFVLCGRGELKTEIRRRMRAMPQAPRLLAPGYVPREDLPAAYQAFDVVLYLGIGSDKTCRGLLEAMASGRPIVAVREGAVPDIIEHGVTGLLVEKADTPGLARSIEELLGNPERAAALGAAARRAAETHHCEDLRAREVCAAYEQALSARSNKHQ